MYIFNIYVFPSEQTSCIHFCPQEPGKTLSTENITVTALKAEETDGYTITEVSSIEEVCVSRGTQMHMYIDHKLTEMQFCSPLQSKSSLRINTLTEGSLHELTVWTITKTHSAKLCTSTDKFRRQFPASSKSILRTLTFLLPVTH